MRKSRFFLPALLILCLICGCGAGKNGDLSGSAGSTESANTYRLYCVNTGETQVVSETFEAESTDPQELILEMIRRLSSEPTDFTFKKAILDEYHVNSWNLEGDILSLDFSSGYRNLSGIAEVLRRACIVKTLCQIEEVDFVQMTVEGQPIMQGEADPVGMMSAMDFIDNTGGETTYNQKVVLTLYYTDEEGKKLVTSRHQIEFDGTISLAALALQQLVDGPLPEEHLKRTIPENTQILKTSTKDGICYVDLSQEFLTKMVGVDDAVTIYSIVNTLTELSGVNQVAFTIAGSTEHRFHETMDFDVLFERNLELITE